MPQTISPAEAQRRIEAGAVLIDIRNPDEYARAHIPCARNLPLTQIGRTSDRVESFLRQQIAVSKDLPTFPMFGLPSLYIPHLVPGVGLGSLLLPAFLVTLVSFLETASSAKVDNAKAGTLWNENQDLIGQGLAKIASGLTGSFPTSSSFSRSAITLYAGARTGWAR